jgi:hypothetical protein
MTDLQIKAATTAHCKTIISSRAVLTFGDLRMLIPSLPEDLSRVSLECWCEDYGGEDPHPDHEALVVRWETTTESTKVES